MKDKNKQTLFICLSAVSVILMLIGVALQIVGICLNSHHTGEIVDVVGVSIFLVGLIVNLVVSLAAPSEKDKRIKELEAENAQLIETIHKSNEERLDRLEKQVAEYNKDSDKAKD